MATPAALAAARLGRANKVAELAKEAAAASAKGWASVSTATADPPSLPRLPDNYDQFRRELQDNYANKVRSDKSVAQQRFDAEIERQIALSEGRDDAAPALPAYADQRPAITTFRDLVGRWYENAPGGLDAAIQSSHKALKEFRPTSSYGHWPEYAVEANIPVYKRPQRSGVLGSYSPMTGEVALDTALSSADELGTLEHEATHHLLKRPHGLIEKGMTISPSHPHIEDKGPFWRQPRRLPTLSDTFASRDNDLLRPLVADQYRARTPGYEPGDVADDDPAMQHARYLTSRVEIDPRLADIRRRYALQQGQDVKTPDDARAAWEWWRDAQEAWHNAPRDRPSMTASDFALLDKMPDHAKDVLFRRMTQIPAVLAPLAIGAGAQQQQGVLSGLKETR
jgi:hypothetical protein